MMMALQRVRRGVSIVDGVAIRKISSTAESSQKFSNGRFDSGLASKICPVAP